MHPQIKEHAAGKCPICHMNLTKIEIEKDIDGESEIKLETKADLYACDKYPDMTDEKPGPCPLDGTPMVKVKSTKRAQEIVAKVKLKKAHLKHFNPAIFPVTEMKMKKTIQLLGNVIQSEEKESKIPARTSGRVEKVYISTTGAYVKVGDPVVDFL